MKHLVDKTILVPFQEELKYAVCIVSGWRFPAFRQGKHRVRLYASRSSGRKPGPTFAARGPNGIEKKCAFLQGQNYDTVDKENTISRNAEKTAPVCPCEPLCRTNGGGEASICPQNPASALVGAGWRKNETPHTCIGLPPQISMVSPAARKYRARRTTFFSSTRSRARLYASSWGR